MQFNKTEIVLKSHNNNQNGNSGNRFGIMKFLESVFFQQNEADMMMIYMNKRLQ